MSQTARRAEVFPHLGQFTALGIVAGPILATALGWWWTLDPSATWVRAIVGMLIGGFLGMFVAISRAVAPPWSPRPQTSSGSRALWDPWLDAPRTTEPLPSVAEPAGAGEADAELSGERAPVRPRVLSPETGDTLLLEEEVRRLLAQGEIGVIRVDGPAGSGKSSALRHLAAELPPLAAVRILDDAEAGEISAAARQGLVVYSSTGNAYPKHLVRYQVAPWGRDDLIEYLLSVDRPRCASVMSRLAASADADLAPGVAELWRIVLDRMRADESLPSARAALRQELAGLADDPEWWALLRRTCLAAVAISGSARDVAAAIHRDVRPAESPLPLTNLAALTRHRPIQLLLAADGLMAALEETRWVPNPQLERLPRDLVRETAVLVAAGPCAREQLARILAGADRNFQPMAASLLLAADSSWRPDPANGLRLSGAYLAGASWAGINLELAKLNGVDFSGANLSGARLDRAEARRAWFRGADLRSASLDRCLAPDADLSGANLAWCQAPAANLIRANLEGANLKWASLRQAYLNQANLQGACLAETTLVDACLEEARIEGTDFTGADLRASRLRGLVLNRSRLTGARFALADLSMANLEGVELAAPDFQCANLRGALLTGSRMPLADFVAACLAGAGLAEIDWPHANLRNADLLGATFHLGTTRSGLVQSPIACEGSRTGFYTDDFADQDFKSPEEIRKANLCGADLRGARINNVDFYLVDLRGARLDPAQLPHLRQCGAILDPE